MWLETLAIISGIVAWYVNVVFVLTTCNFLGDGTFRGPHGAAEMLTAAFFHTIAAAWLAASVWVIVHF